MTRPAAESSGEPKSNQTTAAGAIASAAPVAASKAAVIVSNIFIGCCLPFLAGVYGAGKWCAIVIRAERLLRPREGLANLGRGRTRPRAVCPAPLPYRGSHLIYLLSAGPMAPSALNDERSRQLWFASAGVLKPGLQRRPSEIWAGVAASAGPESVEYALRTG